MKTRCDLIIEADNKLFNNRTQEPTFVLFSFQKLDRSSLQEIECETQAVYALLDDVAGSDDISLVSES